MLKFKFQIVAFVVWFNFCSAVYCQNTVPKIAADAHKKTGTKLSNTNQEPDVIVKTDRFSSTTIMLKAQKLIETPDTFLTVAGNSKYDNKPITGLSEADELVILTFDIQSTKDIEKRDQEIKFLVDGKPLKSVYLQARNSLLSKPIPSEPYKKRQVFIGSFSIPIFQQIVAGRKVEIQIGAFETTLSERFLNNLKDFIHAYQTAQERK